jgi:hypothetical protein
MKDFFTTATPLKASPCEINGKTKIINATKQKYKLDRRIPKVGFPITTKFTSAHEIYDYLHGEKITCLLCGRSFKSLCAHVSKIHLMSADEYKEMYGLPFRCGLSSEATKEIYRDRGSKPEQLERLKKMRTPENRVKCVEASKTQRNSGLKKIISRERIINIGHPGSLFNASHGELILSYMEKNDCSLSESLRKTDLMTRTTFYNLIKSYPELKAAERIKNGSHGKRSPIKYKTEVLERIRYLRSDGKKFKEIGIIIGIHEEYASLLARGATKK